VVARQAHNLEVTGSNPVAAIVYIKELGSKDAERLRRQSLYYPGTQFAQ
jgi:hypothetical protein